MKAQAIIQMLYLRLVISQVADDYSLFEQQEDFDIESEEVTDSPRIKQQQVDYNNVLNTEMKYSVFINQQQKDYNNEPSIKMADSPPVNQEQVDYDSVLNTNIAETPSILQQNVNYDPNTIISDSPSMNRGQDDFVNIDNVPTIEMSDSPSTNQQQINSDNDPNLEMTDSPPINQQEVLRKVTIEFTKVIYLCNKKLYLSMDALIDILFFWKKEWSLETTETGCLLYCIVTELDLYTDEGHVLEDNVENLLSRFHADTEMKQAILALIDYCRDTVVDMRKEETNCWFMLEFSRCFRQGIDDVGWWPDLSDLYKSYEQYFRRAGNLPLWEFHDYVKNKRNQSERALLVESNMRYNNKST